MPKGGARPGSGRPKGSTSPWKIDRIMGLVTNNAIIHAIPEDIARLSAVEIMMYCSQHALSVGDYRTAWQSASAAAPYMHSKLNTVLTLNQGPTSELPSSVLREMLALCAPVIDGSTDGNTLGAINPDDPHV